MKSPIKNILHQQFGGLTAIGLVGFDGRRSAEWLCRCVCGKFKVVSARYLTRGSTKSCGCLKRENSNFIASRFWDFVEKTETCWLWTGRKNAKGYGYLPAFGRDERAHRYAWFLTYGDLPKQFLLHSCHVPNCVNPKHLREGTHQENMADVVERNRQRKRGGQFKPEDQATANAIRAEYISIGTSYRKLAAKYSVTKYFVVLAVKGGEFSVR